MGDNGYTVIICIHHQVICSEKGKVMASDGHGKTKHHVSLDLPYVVLLFKVLVFLDQTQKINIYMFWMFRTAHLPGKEVVEWAAGGGKNDPAAEGWFRNMPSISGVKFNQANVADFQRLYYCAPPGILDLLMSLADFFHGEPHYDWGIVFGKIWLIFFGFRRVPRSQIQGKDKFCGVPPCTGCSEEPCNDCFAGHQIYASLRPGCDGNNRGIGCVPPKSAMGDLGADKLRLVFGFLPNSPEIFGCTGPGT